MSKYSKLDIEASISLNVMTNNILLLYYSNQSVVSFCEQCISGDVSHIKNQVRLDIKYMMKYIDLFYLHKHIKQVLVNQIT